MEIAPDLNLYDSPYVQALIVGTGGHPGKPMLAGLDKLLYMHIREVIQAAMLKRPPYNPYLYESLLEDVSVLLDRCLAYRTACAGLEAEAIRYALDYQLFDKLMTQEAILQELQTATKKLEAEKNAQERASQTFGSAPPLDNGLKTLLELNAQGLGFAIANKRDIREALAERLTLLKNHRALLEQRHTTPGHALNFKERRDHLIQYIVQDVEEAYQKARAARAGLKQQLLIKDSQKFPFPEIKRTKEDAGFLDALVQWTRDVIRRFELAVADDVQFERIIPLVEPYCLALDEKDDQRLNTKKQLDDAMTTPKGLLGDIYPSRAIPEEFDFVRLRGVGLSVKWSGPGPVTEEHKHSWSAVIVLPGQIDPYTDNLKYPGFSVVLGNVPIFQTDDPPPIASGQEVWNANPKGEWNLFMEPMMINAGGDKYKLKLSNRI